MSRMVCKGKSLSGMKEKIGRSEAPPMIMSVNTMRW